MNRPESVVDKASSPRQASAPRSSTLRAVVVDAHAAVSTTELTRTFGMATVLDRVSLTIPHGMVYGLLGPNGAGKTTLIRILATLLSPTSGQASVAGADVVSQAAEVRSRIGLAGQFAAVDNHLSGRENLVMVGRVLTKLRTAGIEPRGVGLRRPSLDDVFLTLTAPEADHSNRS